MSTRILIFLPLVFLCFNANAQICVNLEDWEQTAENGDGTCTYNITITINAGNNSGNSSKGTATFTLDGNEVYSVDNCFCSPETITFPITVTCGSTINIEGTYDGPGNGGDCSGETGDFTLSDPAMPLSWHSIEGINIGKNNIIRWSTTQEINLDEYIIEHSLDGKKFAKLDKLAPTGITHAINKYEYLHRNIQDNTTNYYRIKQVDIDGQYSYSPIEAIENSTKSITVFPNPVKDILFINSENQVNWKVLEITGRKVSSGFGNEVNTSPLKQGYYLIQLHDGNQYIQKMILKQ